MSGKYERLRREAERRVEEWCAQRNGAGLPSWAVRGGAARQGGTAVPLETGGAPARSRVSGGEADYYVARFPRGAEARQKRIVRFSVRVQKGARVSLYASCSAAEPSEDDCEWSLCGVRHGHLGVPGGDPSVREGGLVYLAVVLADDGEDGKEGGGRRARRKKGRRGRATAIAAVPRSNYTVEAHLQWQQSGPDGRRQSNMTTAERVAAKIERGRERRRLGLAGVAAGGVAAKEGVEAGGEEEEGEKEEEEGEKEQVAAEVVAEVAPGTNAAVKGSRPAQVPRLRLPKQHQPPPATTPKPASARPFRSARRRYGEDSVRLYGAMTERNEWCEREVAPHLWKGANFSARGQHGRGMSFSPSAAAFEPYREPGARPAGGAARLISFYEPASPDRLAGIEARRQRWTDARSPRSQPSTSAAPPPTPPQPAFRIMVNAEESETAAAAAATLPAAQSVPAPEVAKVAPAARAPPPPAAPQSGDRPIATPRLGVADRRTLLLQLERQVEDESAARRRAAAARLGGGADAVLLRRRREVAVRRAARPMALLLNPREGEGEGEGGRLW